MSETERTPVLDLYQIGVTPEYRFLVVGKIRRFPVTGLGQTTTVGQTEKRQDLRTPQVIYSGQPGGMGRFEYVEMDGVDDFTDSTLDTRFECLTLPPGRTQLGAAIGGGALTGQWKVEYLNQADAKVIAWGREQAATCLYYYDTSPAGWNAVAAPSQLTGFCNFGGLYCLASASGGNAIYTSPDGVTWTGSGYAKPARGICVHDNHVYIYNETDQRLEWQTTATAAAGWSTSPDTLKLFPGEKVRNLIEWRDPKGKPAVFLLTSQRILWYDDDADQFQTFAPDIAGGAGGSFYSPHAAVFLADSNLYVALPSTLEKSISATAQVYSGVTEQTGPNIKGGLPVGEQMRLWHAAGGINWLYWFADSDSNTTPGGRVLAMNPQRGFHTIGKADAGTRILGGGYARGLTWAVQSDGKIYEFDTPDNKNHPLLASGRTYRTGAWYYHEFAFTDGGAENMPSTAEWVTVKCRNQDNSGVPGLPSGAGCQVEVAVRRDVDASWTVLNTLGSSDTFPAVCPINSGNGLAFREFKVRIGMISTNAAKSPMLDSVAFAFSREETPRFQVQCEVDLTEETWGLDQSPMGGQYNLRQLRDALDAMSQPGVRVRARYGGASDSHPNVPGGRTIANAKLEYAGDEDPVTGLGTFTISLTDLTPPASG